MNRHDNVSSPSTLYPEGDGLQKYVKRRRRKGTIWRSIFLLSTTIAIIALSVLLLTVINDSFGYVALQNKIDPEELVLNHFKGMILASGHQVTSEDEG